MIFTFLILKVKLLQPERQSKYGQVLFVWRESFEALLVVGIIYAWINSPTPQQV